MYYNDENFNFYKITNIFIGKTKKGIDFCKIELDESFYVVAYNPFNFDETKNWDEYKNNYEEITTEYNKNKSLKHLINQFVDLNFKKTQYGNILEGFRIFNPLELQNLIEKYNGEYFYAGSDFYYFLKNNKKRKVENDHSIKLKTVFNDLRIYKTGICMEHNVNNKKLHANNIEDIFNNFFINKREETEYYHKLCRGQCYMITYKLGIDCIYKVEHYAKQTMKMHQKDKLWEKSSMFLRIGDDLTMEQLEYLKNKKGNNEK